MFCNSKNSSKNPYNIIGMSTWKNFLCKNNDTVRECSNHRRQPGEEFWCSLWYHGIPCISGTGRSPFITRQSHEGHKMNTCVQLWSKSKNTGQPKVPATRRSMLNKKTSFEKTATLRQGCTCFNLLGQLGQTNNLPSEILKNIISENKCARTMLIGILVGLRTFQNEAYLLPSLNFMTTLRTT